MSRQNKSLKITTLINIVIGGMFIAMSVAIVILVNYYMRQQALHEAEAKMRLILDRNLAVHTYFSQILKPNLFAWSEPYRSDDYFDPSWMSSTYAVREMGNYFKEFSLVDYYYKDAAVHARSPENEADAEERAFIEELKINPSLEERSSIRVIAGLPYLVVLWPGEVLEESCLRCHSDPQDAPKGLVRYYGSERSFHREAELGTVVSAVSIRVPLAEAYAEADRVSLHLSLFLVALLGVLFLVQSWLLRRLVFTPVKMLRNKAQRISEYSEHLGEQIPPPFGEELGELASAFNAMSVNLHEAQEQLVRQERLAVLGQLAGSVGHELRNPLGVISNAVYFLNMIQPDANETVKEYLGIIENETRASNKIVNELLDFTRIKSLDRKPAALLELVQQTLERFPAPPAVAITLEFPEQLPALFADPDHVMRVLGNLIVNAYQAMDSPDQTGGKLTISAGVQRDMIRVSLQDTGTGIAPENMGKIFEPLFTTKTRGFGLGLAVSRKLTEANNGQIEVSSVPGQGSTFTVYWPIYRP